MNWKQFSLTWQKTDRFITIPLLLSLIVFVFLHLVFFITSPALPNKLPLFYSLPWGDQQLVNKTQFLLLPAVILFITIINSAFAWRLHSSQTLLRRMLFLTILV